MTQCKYDGVFYRVFCVTLLAIAFTFTVILTNVFIDIDGMLANKEKVTSETPDSVTTTPEPSQDIENNELFYQSDVKDKKLAEEVYRQDKEDVKDNNEVFQPSDNQDPEAYDLKSERDDDYRTKRSIDTPNKFHLANPKMKEILNNRLSTLLEELDAEESQAGKEEKQKLQEPVKPVEITNLKNTSEEKDKDRNTEDNEVLHLAMHNILLKGIIGHKDLNEVYNKVHDLVQSFDENDEGASRRSMHGASEINAENEPKFHNYPEIGKRIKTKESLELMETPQNLFSVESKFFDELVRCDQLQKQISSVASAEARLTRRSGSKKVEVKAPKMLIKTIIDIKTTNRNDKQNNSYTNVNTNNIKGLIKLIYNGKSINFSRLTDDETENKNHPEDAEIIENKPNIKTNSVLNDDENIVDNFLDKALAEYLKKYPKLESKFRRRPKRSVKVHKHSKDATTEIKKKSDEEEKENPKKKKKPDEEEFYVEIETHFDSKGHNGEKKKKLIKAIIAKIQKALRVNIDTLQKVGKASKKAKISEMLQIKKRIQNPLKVKEENILSNKITLPVEGIVLRKSEPISKSIKLTDPVPKIYDQMGEIWKKTYTGSSFLSNSKSINSGEMGLVDLDYSRVGKDNGIPQRLQQPLNSDNIDNSEYYNLGDLKFYVKEIDGTGFSIGFNQYVGDAPDPESIKLFTGLQQLINVYNQNSDNDTNSDNKVNFVDGEHEVSKRDVDSVSKLSSIFGGTPKDSHSNEYKVVFDENLLPYDSYSEVFEDGRKKVSFSIEKEEDGGQQPKPESKDVQKNTEILTPIETEAMRFRKNSLPFIIDENLFKKPLKPSEIFGLADLLNRKKRSPIVKIKKYSNMKTRRKPHLNRYLNTKRKVKRIVKNKRNKRQVDKIRIIATDSLPRISGRSDENFYVVSDEKMFADRTVVREIDIPEQEQSRPEERNDFVLSHHMSNQLPSYNIFSSRSRQNALMSKYPHLFLEEITRSEEDDNRGFYNKLLGNYADLQKTVEPTPSPYSIVTPYAASDSKNTHYSYANIYDGSEPRPNYKLTLRIIPKNQSVVPTGFKSVRTSINKTINRNGVLFLSQVNVSELSKVENLNGDVNKQFSTKTSVPEDIRNLTGTVESTPKPMQIKVGSDTFPLVKHIKEQQEKMKMLLRQHKQRIDDQLDSLKQEKLNIDSMIIRGGIGETTTTPPEVKKPETIDVLLPLNPPQMLHFNKDEAGRLISNALMKLHDAPHLNDISDKNQPNSNKMQVSPTTPSTTTTQATTTIPPTQPKKTVDPERIKLLRTIQRNENLTNVILYKIDRNTNLLHHFLQKLTDRLEPTQRPEYIQEKVKMPEPTEWKPTLHEPFFPQNIPNMEVNKNATHIAIPFIYAYQQPYPLPAANNPVASVVYQGHIHTNAFKNAASKITQKPSNDKLPDKREANTTKFFIDDVEPGFKLVPVPLRKLPYDITRIKNNVTTENNIRNL